jgi:hypothetical protein
VTVTERNLPAVTKRDSANNRRCIALSSAVKRSVLYSVSGDLKSQCLFSKLKQSCKPPGACDAAVMKKAEGYSDAESCGALMRAGAFTEIASTAFT